MLPEAYLEGLDKLVKQGRYSSRSAAIRYAVMDQLRRELWRQVGEAREVVKEEVVATRKGRVRRPTAVITLK